MTTPPKHLYRFADFEFDAAERLLYRAGQPVHVPPKQLELLLLLIERRGSVVSKDEIVRAVWPNTIVEEIGVARNISLLRKLLDEKKDESCIKTIPKRGYQFVAAVTEPRSQAPWSMQEQSATHGEADFPHWATFGLTMLALLILGAFVGPTLWSSEKDRATTSVQRLEVAPKLAGAISPDGGSLAFAHNGAVYVQSLEDFRTSRWAVVAGTVTDISWDVHGSGLLLRRKDASGGDSSMVSLATPGANAHILPDAIAAVTLPNGSQLALLRTSGEIWITGLAGSGGELLHEVQPAHQALARLQISRDGQHILYAYDDPHAYRAAIEARQVASDRVIQLFETSDAILDFALLTSNDLLVAHALRGDTTGAKLSIVRIDLSTGTARLAHTTAQWADVRPYSIAATVDGRNVSFVKSADAAEIYIAEIATDNPSLSRLRRLSLEPADGEAYRLTFVRSTAAEAASAEAAAPCLSFAETAVSLARQTQGCPLRTGGSTRWHEDYDAYYRWCMEKGPRIWGWEEQILINEARLCRGEARALECRDYPEIAVAQEERNLTLQCGLTGGRWHSDRDAHFHWCLQVTSDSSDFEQQMRGLYLDACAAREPARQCRDAARRSLAQIASAKINGCGYSGELWQDSEDQQLLECATHGVARFDARMRMREQLLRECGVKAAPQQLSRNP